MLAPVWPLMVDNPAGVHGFPTHATLGFDYPNANLFLAVRDYIDLRAEYQHSLPYQEGMIVSYQDLDNTGPGIIVRAPVMPINTNYDYNQPAIQLEGGSFNNSSKWRFYYNRAETGLSICFNTGQNITLAALGDPEVPFLPVDRINIVSLFSRFHTEETMGSNCFEINWAPNQSNPGGYPDFNVGGQFRWYDGKYTGSVATCIPVSHKIQAFLDTTAELQLSSGNRFPTTTNIVALSMWGGGKIFKIRTMPYDGQNHYLDAGYIDLLNIFLDTKKTELKGSLVHAVAALVYGGTIQPDSNNGKYQDVTATNANAFTIFTPLNGQVGQEIVITVWNNNAVAPNLIGDVAFGVGYRLLGGNNTISGGAKPTLGTGLSILFRYRGTAWYEVSRSGLVPV